MNRHSPVLQPLQVIAAPHHVRRLSVGIPLCYGSCRAKCGSGLRCQSWHSLSFGRKTETGWSSWTCKALSQGPLASRAVADRALGKSRKMPAIRSTIGTKSPPLWKICAARRWPSTPPTPTSSTMRYPRVAARGCQRALCLVGTYSRDLKGSNKCRCGLQVPTEYFLLCLGRHMKYSCCYYPGLDSKVQLGDAEKAMLGAQPFQQPVDSCHSTQLTT